MHLRMSAASAVLMLLVAVNACPQELRWYRGNTHAQTKESDISGFMDLAAAWYASYGYDFLCNTDLNTLTPPSAVRLPPDVHTDFILIPAEEIVTMDVRATAMNIRRTVTVPYVGESLSGTLQECLQAAEHAGGILILNHPNLHFKLTAADIRQVKGLRLFELYNCYPVPPRLGDNEGDATHPSTESLWDSLLTDGMVIFGVACDEAMYISTSYVPYLPGPGRGWIMVQAEELSARCICDAMMNGRFYATIGPLLKRLELSPTQMCVEIDQAATEAELGRGSAFGRPAPQDAKVGERVDFIGPGGRVLASYQGLSAAYTPSGTGYVRARAVVTRQIDGKLVEFCAWTQPVFLD
jgi:hypothetical protein